MFHIGKMDDRFFYREKFSISLFFALFSVRFGHIAPQRVLWPPVFILLGCCRWWALAVGILSVKNWRQIFFKRPKCSFSLNFALFSAIFRHIAPQQGWRPPIFIWFLCCPRLSLAMVKESGKNWWQIFCYCHKC